MLDKKRIKEAEDNVRSYLNEGLLKKTELNQQIINILLRNAKESLRVAEEIRRRNLSELWVIVCSYYAMYYYANAVLMKFGCKVGEKIVHKVTSDALIVYVRGKLKASLIEEYEETREEALNLAGIKADSLVESFDFERKKRSVIQYQTIEAVKHSKANTSLQRAKEFAKEMDKLILKITFTSISMKFYEFVREVYMDFDFSRIFHSPFGKRAIHLGWRRKMRDRGRDQLKCLRAYFVSYLRTGMTARYCRHGRCPHYYEVISLEHNLDMTEGCEREHWLREVS